MNRSQLWWAYGQLEVMRQYCINLARLQHNFSDPEVGEEPYFKIEKAIPVEYLSPLAGTCCPLEKMAMLHASIAVIRFYKKLATSLAQAYGLEYPEILERVMAHRLEKMNVYL